MIENENALLMAYFRVLEGECRLILDRGVCCVRDAWAVIQILRKARKVARKPLIQAIDMGIVDSIDGVDSFLIRKIGLMRAIRENSKNMPEETLVTGEKIFKLLGELGDIESVFNAVDSEAQDHLPVPVEDDPRFVGNPGSVN